jgi:hypothetical protein
MCGVTKQNLDIRDTGFAYYGTDVAYESVRSALLYTLALEKV